MAERGTINSGIRLDMQQLQLEARHRWLRPAEICEILRNYHRFQISSEPPSRPPSGSLFLFDRKVLRYFRKDGHNWRKKKDGKTIKEAHEKLKVGSIDVLHCYYAHGEDNENFQRRSYWLLEEDFMHIVFVHYLETKGNKSSIRDMEYISNSQRTSSLSNSYCTHSESFSANAGSPSATSALTAAFEDVDSGDNLQAISKFPVHFHFQHRGEVLDDDKTGATLNNSKLHVVSPGNPLLVPELSCDSTDSGEAKVVNPTSQSTIHDLESWEEVFEQCNRGSEPGLAYPLVSSTLPTGLEFIGQENGKFGQLLDNNLAFSSVFEGPAAETDWQKNIQLELSSTEFHGNPGMEEDLKYNSSILKQPLLGSLRAEEGLLKVDSFSKWMSKELGDGGELQLGSPSNISWCNNAPDESSISLQLDLDSYSLSPSISQDQLFSILDFSPNRAYTDYETEVIVMGKFLKSQQEIAKYNWSCMFGEVEVPAEIVGDGVLCCYAPPHSVGRVPFYVTCSNRLACSEVREFEFQDRHGIAGGETHGNSIDEQLLHRRLEILVSINSDRVSVPAYGDISGKQQIISKINLLMDGETGSAFWEAASQNRSALSKTLKEKLYVWLLDKVNEDGKGPNVLDKEGQGVLHLAAALGYDWVIQPILIAGVSINFRDVNGWTALHWAAFCGREKMVALLVALGAAPGALTDPSPESPLCRTPADLASANGFKGISGFLAESSLTTHLASLNMSDQKVDVSTEDAVRRAVQAIAERSATPAYEDDASLKDSLAAVCNATQAAGRIHQVYRMQSFQRKQMGQYEDDKFGLTDELISSLVSSRMQKAGQYAAEQAQSAAVQIQKKYRGWKKRKEFLIIRQRVVKIQAHIRGYQVRRRYRAVIWSVGILEKVILRWRRKGTGLRGYRSGTQIKEPSTSTQEIPKEDDDYDFLKEGRKQTEERLQKALVRVKSMVQYPEARLQYRRLLTSVEDFQKNQKQQQVYNRILDSPGGATIEGEEDMIDVDKLLDDESFMAIAFD